jgi:hypothetical protein
MQAIVKQVLECAAGFPEGAPLMAKELLYLGGRAAVGRKRWLKAGAQAVKSGRASMHARLGI